MAYDTQKVNPNAEETVADGMTAENETTTAAKKDSGKVTFPIADAMYRNTDGKVVTAVNADGLLIAVPKPIRDAEKKVIYTGFNMRKHLPLKKEVFASIVDHILYQAFIARVRAAILVKSAEDKEAKAKRIAKFGDDTTRKNVNKLAKLTEMVAALQKQLEEDGVDISDI